jgi:hypothetical protein
VDSNHNDLYKISPQGSQPTVSAAYAASVDNNLTKRHPGLKSSELVLWAYPDPATPQGQASLNQFNPNYWAGIDCSGLENVAVNYAKLDARIADWITPRFGDIPAVSSGGSNNDKVIGVSTFGHKAFPTPAAFVSQNSPASTADDAWSYLVSDRNPNSTTINAWQYLHRGDSIANKGEHITTSYSDHTGAVWSNFVIIQSSGVNLWNVGAGAQKFGRKVTVSDMSLNTGNFNPRFVMREVLW